MLIASISKEAIEKSEFTIDQLAVDADMSVANLYRIYKKDSVESRYLIRICRKLGIPYSALLGPEDCLDKNDPKGSNVMIANRTAINNQHYNIGAGSSDAKLMHLRHELQLCQVEKESLANQLRLQVETNKLLREK